MSIFKSLVFASLAAATISIVNAEPHCPGNVDSLRLRLIQNAQIIVPITINHTGPYDFLLDTGAQITTVDPVLAKALALKIEGTTGIIGVGNYARTPFTRLDSVRAGSQVVEQVMAVIQDLGQIQIEDSRVRGVLAGNFLENFGVLIDYHDRIVCLDKGDAIEVKVKGQRVGLVKTSDSRRGPHALTVAVRLSGISKGSLPLRLDSGVNVPLLYPSAETAHLVDVGTSPLRSRGTDGIDHTFAVLTRQEVQIGPHTLHAIPFVMPVSEAKNIPRPDADGLLPTALFARIYINYAHDYVVLVPWL
jgi:Aspartyl protease